MNLYYLLLIAGWVATDSFAQTQSPLIKDLATTLAETKLEGAKEVDGADFIPLIQSPYPDCNTECCASSEPSTVQKPAKEKSTYTEIVAIIEAASPRDVAMDALKIDNAQNAKLSLGIQSNFKSELLNAFPATSASIKNLDELNTLVNLMASNWNLTALMEPPSSLGFRVPADMQRYAKVVYRDLQAEALLYYVSQMNSSSDETISKEMASFIQKNYQSDEDKMVFLAQLSDKFYEYYNDARNPGSNNAENNPNKIAIPSGRLSLKQIIQAHENQNFFDGGVCNDISEAIAKIGAKVFPNKDVLTITGGSHFGVLVADGNGSTVIDGGTRYQVKNQIALMPDAAVTNVRVSKVVNGKLKEIGVVDTQLGQLVSNTFGNELPLLKSGANINSVLLQSKKVWDKGDGVKKQLTTSLANAELANGNTTIITAKVQSDNKKTHAYLGIGAGVGKYGDDTAETYQLYLKSGMDRKLLKYVNPKAHVYFTTGVHTDLQVSSTAGYFDNTGLAGGLNLRNQIKADAQVGKTTLRGEAQVIHSLGPRSWGDTTGAVSTENFHNVVKMLGFTTFHLNQVDGIIQTSTLLTTKTNLETSAQYQGSALGQTVQGAIGVTVLAKNDAKISTYIGNKIVTRGYQTKFNVLGDVPGIQAGAEYNNKNGKKFKIQAEGLGTSKAGASGTVILPISKKKKGP